MFLCQRELVSLGVSGMFLDPAWKTPHKSTQMPGLEAKIRLYLLRILGYLVKLETGVHVTPHFLVEAF